MFRRPLDFFPGGSLTATCGRVRRTGAAAERARVNVQRRIRGAIKKIAETLPDLGSYLDRAVKTGTFCSYEPF